MKKLYSIFALIFLAIILITARSVTSSTGDAFSWSWFISLGNSTVKTQTQNIEANGNNLRAYFSDIQDPNTGKWYRCKDTASTVGLGSTCWESAKPKD